jgi:hypothetical protein
VWIGERWIGKISKNNGFYAEISMSQIQLSWGLRMLSGAR